MQSRRGRPRLNDSETLIRTYTVSERDFLKFRIWCRKNGFSVSEIIRLGVKQLMKEGNISDLLEDAEMRNLAIELLKRQFENKSKN